jgi:hypothetical protein
VAIVRGSLAALVWLGVLASGAEGQTPVRGTVLALESGAPLVGASVTTRHNGRSVGTDRLGRFRVWVTLPDTLVVTFIGRSPDTVAIEREPVAPLEVRLRPLPVQLSAIAVTATGRSRDVASLGQWRLTPEEARGVPPAVEVDVFRALALSPAVNFTTPLSARPMIRGFDAGGSAVRIDGHAVFNLYHIGRIFSAFPAEAAQQVGVTAAPARVTEGGDLSGAVDITGRSGAPGEVRGGANLSLASASTWVGGGGRAARWFGAARAVHFGLIAALVGQDSPYDFQDFYGSLVLGDAARPRGRVTVFASRDDLDTDADSMAWSNLLVGSRWQLLDLPGFGLSQSVSVTRFAQAAPGVHARNSILDVRNRLARIGTGFELAVERARSRIVLGAEGGWRSWSNAITPVVSSGDVVFRRVEAARLELAASLEWSQSLGPATIQLGTRVDATGSARAVQPRGRVHVPLARLVSVSAGVGRTAQLQHQVSDPRSEPDLTFYDFWLSAADSGVPVATADHFAAELDFRRGAWSGRVSVFGARARGLVELRPERDVTALGESQFRVGRGRTRGVETQIAIGGTATRASSLSLAYVVSASERDWGSGWVPWSEDRRHLLRVLGQWQLSRRWTVFGGVEGQSGVPLTPVDQVSPERSYRFGVENSIRSAGTARLDLGARYLFGGPWGSRAALGLSVLNVAFGPVAPLVVSDPERVLPPEPPTIRIGWERAYVLPPIPTITLRMEF